MSRTTIQLDDETRKKLKVLASERDVSYQKLLEDMISVFRELNKTKTIISIPSSLSDKIKEKMEGTDIKSVSEYVTFLLRLVLSEDNGLDKKGQERIKKQLKNLSYL